MARLVIATAIAIPTLALAGGHPARADQGADEARVVTLANEARTANGAARIGVDPVLASVARNWAGVMAGNGTISHNPNLASQVTVGWLRLGENVGMGGSVDIVHRAFLTSPNHFQNMVEPAYNAMGAGVVSAGSSVFVVQVFAHLVVPPLVANEAPAVPSSLNPAHGALLRSSPAQLTATYADPDGTAGHVYFVLVDSAGRVKREGWSGLTGSGATAGLSAPSLADDTYALYAIASDGWATSAWSAPTVFAVNRTAPTAPTSITGSGGTVSARYADPDGSPGYVYFWVVDGSGRVAREGWSGRTASGATASLAVGGLARASYTLYAVAFDGLASPIAGPVAATLG
jgi:hypothetical protein